jgi:DNA-directed RNA polymerase subunit RPC12/RpoP
MSNLLAPMEVNEETPVFDSDKRSKIMSDYLCAKCWGELKCSPLPHDQWFVYCPKCGDNIGFVTRNYVENRRTQDRGDYLDVYYLLTTLNLLPEEETNKTEERLLEELGF